MSGCRYDLHIHSALSPCADNDMTPNNIVNMAMVNQLELIALTDHNSCKNCPAFIEAAARTSVQGIPGMELTTSEEIHMICLFSSLDAAMGFDGYVQEHLPSILNDEAIFGEQLILDGEDRVIGKEPKLLIQATTISVDELARLSEEFGFITYPAHIDRDSYSMLSSFGVIPDEYGFRAVEVANPQVFFANWANERFRQRYLIITSSDAHYLWNIMEDGGSMALSSPDFAGLAAFLQQGGN